MSAAVEIEATNPLIFTDNAAVKVSELIKEENQPGLMLRVFVQGGGCSGFQYGFTFDEAVQDGDTVVEKQGVKLLVDPMSMMYLTGAEIDYVDNLEGAQFVIRNPMFLPVVVAVRLSQFKFSFSHKKTFQHFLNRKVFYCKIVVQLSSSGAHCFDVRA